MTHLASELPAADDVEKSLVYVLEDDGVVLGFYSLKDKGDHVELLQVFLRTHLIGHGYGRRLRDHSVGVGASVSDRMLIMSDPKSVGFYRAMGATLERMQEVAPGFSPGIFWYEVGVADG
jgi:hypothetical protein